MVQTSNLSEVKAGDIISRHLGGVVMQLRVTEVTDKLIKCFDWTFDKKTGAEIDEELGWGPSGTGSYITTTGNC